MGGKIYVGAENVARKPSGIYVGVNNVAKKVKAGYIGVGGVAKKFWPINLIPDTRYQSLSYVGFIENTSYLRLLEFILQDPFYNYKTRIVYKFKTLREAYYGINLFTPGYADSYGGATAVHYDGSSTSSNFLYNAYLNNDKFLFRFEEANWPSESDERYIRTNLSSTSTEQFIVDSLYTIDFNNNNNVYLYNDIGYYSIASHNLIGTFRPLHQSFTLIYPSTSVFRIIVPNYTIFYSAKIYNNGTLIKDFIPCYRLSDMMIGIYDLVNRIVVMDDERTYLTDSRVIYSI